MGKGRKNKPKKNFAEKRREKQKVQFFIIWKVWTFWQVIFITDYITIYRCFYAAFKEF